MKLYWACDCNDHRIEHGDPRSDRGSLYKCEKCGRLCELRTKREHQRMLRQVEKCRSIMAEEPEEPDFSQIEDTTRIQG